MPSRTGGGRDGRQVPTERLSWRVGGGKVEKVFPEYIRLDGGTQPRAKIDQSVCDDYGERMKAGEKFPPIDVFFDGQDYWLADGFHRIQAYMMAVPGEAIECNVYQGSLQDAQWHSYGVNKTHGVRRTNADKERAVRAALAHPRCQGLSDAAVADHVGVHRNTVLKIRHDTDQDQADLHNLCKSTNDSPPTHGTGRQSCLRKGRDGRVINTAKIGGSRKRRRPDTPSRRMTFRIQQPTRMPNPMQKMTALNMPHDPVMGARTLIEVFDVEYLRVLADELTTYLQSSL